MNFANAKELRIHMSRSMMMTIPLIAFSLVLYVLSCSGNSVYASGNPPGTIQPTPAGGVNGLHGGFSGYNRHNVSHRPLKGNAPALLSDAVTSSAVTLSGTIVMIHGINNNAVACTGSGGLWSNPINYLISRNPHPGLNGDTITWTGAITTVGFYNGDTGCSYKINANQNNFPNVSRCSGYFVSNSDSSVGTKQEPIEHVACEFAWYIYNGWSRYNSNVKVVAHSLGGLIVRHAIEKAGVDSHFPSALYISDVVTLSSPHGGLELYQLDGGSVLDCWYPIVGLTCYQLSELKHERSAPYQTSSFMNDTLNHDHPQGANGTDWTMEGSLSSDDPVDWFWQATYQSSSHRLGYKQGIPSCQGQPGWPNGYSHGDYVNDMCEAYNAPQYYCDNCNRDSQTYYFTNYAPHSLHNMLLAFVYYNW